jgi:hypothetical protein
MIKIPFCKILIYFQFHHSIQNYSISFLWICFSLFWIFFYLVKVIFLFNFTLELKNYFYLFLSILILIILTVFFQVHYSKLIFHFIFTLQSNIKFIFYFNFNRYSFNFFNHFVLLKFFFFAILSFNIWLIENWSLMVFPILIVILLFFFQVNTD